MNSEKREDKPQIVELEDSEFDLEFDQAFSNFLESSTKSRDSRSKLLRRRLVKRRLDLLKERRWFKQNGWFEDEYLLDVDEVDA